MSDNSLTKLLAVVEPKIQNIEDNRIECSSLKKVQETMSELIELGKISYQDIFNFYDQDFIYKAIKVGNDNSDLLIKKYESSKYLLENKNDDLKELPQFKEAIVYMEQLYQYLYGLNEKIKLDYENKQESLKIQELQNKYYNILKKDNIFVKDIDEFLTFIDLNKLDIIDRLNILIQINKSNIKNYVKTDNILIGNGIYLSDISDLLENNKELTEEQYINDDQDLDLNQISDKFEERIRNKKIYLINKIKELYDDKAYNEIIDYYKEVKKIIDIENEFRKQKNSLNKLIFLFKNDKSLVRDYLDKTNPKYKSCILKNLLDLETNNSLTLPKMCYNNQYIYVKDEFVVKTIYTYIDNYILVLGVLDKKEKLDDFIKRNKYLLDEILSHKEQINYSDQERNIILKDIKLDDLVISIDLDTLDVKVEEENGR